MALKSTPYKLDPNKIKEYRECYLKGIMPAEFMAKEANVDVRSVNSFLANQTYKDEYYQKLLKEVKNGYKHPFEMPIKQKLTDPTKRLLNNYEVGIVKQANYIKDNLCNLTYSTQLAMFIETEENEDDKYLFIVEKNISKNAGFLVPKGKYKVLLVNEGNNEYFVKFLYDEKNGIRIKRVKNYEDYWVAENGRVISIRRGRILTNQIGRKGYLELILPGKNNKKQKFKIHRLVAEAFIPNIYDKPQVNHIDGVKNNNHYTNLEWCTNSENQIHAFQFGLNIQKKGEEANASKLTNAQAEDIRQRYLNKFSSILELAKEYNVTDVTIKNILSYKTYKK